jgi:hypothetical protein
MEGDGRFFPGGASFAVHLLLDAACRVFASRTPRANPNTFGPTLIVRRAGGEAHFTSIVVPFHAEVGDPAQYLRFGNLPIPPAKRPLAFRQVRPCAAGWGFRGVRVMTDAGCDVILHTFDEPAPAAVRDPEIRFEGRFCCLRFDNQGRLTAAKVAAGIRLEVAGKTLFVASDGHPKSYAMVERPSP